MVPGPKKSIGLTQAIKLYPKAVSLVPLAIYSNCYRGLGEIPGLYGAGIVVDKFGYRKTRLGLSSL